MEKELTYGQNAVGLTFNPSNNVHVQKIKESYAAIIEFLNTCRSVEEDSETARLYGIAITEAQTAQMWAVKAITFN